MKNTNMIISNEKDRKAGKEGKLPFAICRKVLAIERSIRSQMFSKLGVLKKIRKFDRKTPVLDSLFNEIAGLQALLKNFIKTSVSKTLFDDVYVIFPIHLSFPVRSSCVLKATIHRKNSGLFRGYLRKLFLFQKDPSYDILHACGI